MKTLSYLFGALIVFGIPLAIIVGLFSIHWSLGILAMVIIFNK